PGEPPFTRGVQPTMYRGRLWTMRQYAGFGTAEDTNARFHSLLAHGQTGLSTAFDLPTQMGYDPDDPRVAGEVGKVGVPIASVDAARDRSHRVLRRTHAPLESDLHQRVSHPRGRRDRCAGARVHVRRCDRVRR